MKHRKDYVGRPSDAVCLVEDAPTIDAIPVDWLVQRVNETSGVNVELVSALFAVGVEWERWKKSMARMEVDE